MYITSLTIMDVDMYVICLKLEDEYRYTNHLSKKLRRSKYKQTNNTRPIVYHTQTEVQTSMKSHTGQLDEMVYFAIYEV